MSENNKDIKDLIAPVTKLQEIARQTHKLFSPIIEQQKKLQEKIFIELPLKTREAVIELGNHGWFLDLEMIPSEVFELKDVFIAGDDKEAESTLVEHFKGRLSEIEKSIINKFPHRKKILMAAFRAHKRMEYELSIPVLLTQADGICFDVIKTDLFGKHNNKPKTANHVKQYVSSALDEALLQSLMQKLPISASKKERDDDFNELNRHAVLHGESFDYGTEVNSFKAISLINYVSWVLELEDEKPKQ